MNDMNAGSALGAQNQSASTVLSALAPATLYALGFFFAFLILRRFYPRIYNPRTFVASLPPQERTPALPKGLLDWFTTFYRTPDLHVLNKQTFDGYMFLRLLRIGVICCLVGCLITWTILIPVNVTGAGGQTQLNLLTFSNVASPKDVGSYGRYYAHALCAYIYFGFIIYMITRESIYYINIRQAYLVSPLYANRISSRTVLFSSVPDEYLNEDRLRRLLGESIVRNVWIPRHVKKLKSKVDERDDVAMTLENAEIQLIKVGNAARRKATKKGDENGEELKALKQDDRVMHSLDTPRTNSDPVASATSPWLDPEKRPTHRLKPLVGKKVDTIDWARNELTRLIPEVEALQEEHRQGKGKPHNAVFVEFETLRDAQSAFQSLTHHEASRMAPRFIGIFPAEIIWSNLRMKWWERYLRFTVTSIFVVALIFFWSFPVSFISTIANINYLVTVPAFAWLGFLNNLPDVVRGLVSGLLPSILLGVLMTLLPPVLRLVAQLGGSPTLSDVEYTLQNSYFWFQLIQVFLVTTLAGGAVKAAIQIYHNPGNALTILATSLPAASNFYLAYISIQGLGVVANTLISLISLALYVILGGLLDKTPRKMFKRWTNLVDPGLGGVYPIYTNLIIIAIVYSCIAPLVLGFAAIGLFFFYVVYRYEFLYVYNVPYDTKGLMYARALQQLFIGLYLAELCLIGLFAISLGKSKVVWGPFILMIIFFVFTIIYHISLNSALRPLLRFLPKTLETEEQRLLALESQEAGAEEQQEYRGADAVRDSTTSQPSFDDPTDAKAKPVTEKEKKSNWLVRWLRPDLYNDYYSLRKMVPRDFANIVYDEELEADGYFHPAVTSDPPTLWVPRDEAGISREECAQTSKVIPMSDRGAVLTGKGKIVWDRDEAMKAPIAKERVYW